MRRFDDICNRRSALRCCEGHPLGASAVFAAVQRLQSEADFFVFMLADQVVRQTHLQGETEQLLAGSCPCGGGAGQKIDAGQLFAFRPCEIALRAYGMDEQRSALLELLGVV